MGSLPGFLFLATEAAKNECTLFSGGEVVQSYLWLALNVYQLLEAGGEGLMLR